jgi:hypothetical protein
MLPDSRITGTTGGFFVNGINLRMAVMYAAQALATRRQLRILARCCFFAARGGGRIAIYVAPRR